MHLCFSSCASLSSRYADAGPNSSVALIHVHYVAWVHPPGSPSSAAPIDLHDLAWHHLDVACHWMFLAPLSTQTTEPKLLSGFCVCAAANFSADLH